MLILTSPHAQDMLLALVQPIWSEQARRAQLVLNPEDALQDAISVATGSWRPSARSGPSHARGVQVLSAFHSRLWNFPTWRIFLFAPLVAPIHCRTGYTPPCRQQVSAEVGVLVSETNAFWVGV
jgi:hypothetical protein